MQTADLRPERHAGSPFIPGECRFARPCSLLRWKTGRHGMLAIRSFLLGRRPVADDLHPQAPCPRIEGLLASHAPRRGVASVLLLRMSWPSTAGRRVPFMPTARRTDRPSIHTNQVGDHTRSSHVLDSGWVARSPNESVVRGRDQLLTSDGASSWCDWRHHRAPGGLGRW
jgi:hypothetical protein